MSCLTLREGLKVSPNGRKRSPLTQVPAIENSSITASTCTTPIGYLARSVPTYGRKLEGRWTDDFPAVPASHFVRFGAIGGPGRPRQLEKAAGTGRRIQEQHAPCFSAGVLPGVCDAAWQKRAGPIDQLVAAADSPVPLDSWSSISRRQQQPAAEEWVVGVRLLNHWPCTDALRTDAIGTKGTTEGVGRVVGLLGRS